jgi:diguanylate cyclase (GGDEF)-like protein
LPYFIPDLSRRQKRQIGVFSAVIVGTFLTLSSLDRRGLLPTAYNVDETLAIAMYNVNATLAFGAIILYTAIYNIRMANKSLELQQMADHDFLTGIFNRQRLQKILDAEIRRAEKLSECHLLVAIADIDFFKEINDTYGHEIGDAALKELSDIFSEHGDKGLIYGRWGGEEFLLIAPENMSYKQFGEMLETLRREVEDNEFAHDDHTIKFTISIGAAEYERGMTAEQLVDLADDRLYSAKGNGRNKVVY